MDDEYNELFSMLQLIRVVICDDTTYIATINFKVCSLATCGHINGDTHRLCIAAIVQTSMHIEGSTTPKKGIRISKSWANFLRFHGFQLLVLCGFFHTCNTNWWVWGTFFYSSWYCVASFTLVTRIGGYERLFFLQLLVLFGFFPTAPAFARLLSRIQIGSGAIEDNRI